MYPNIYALPWLGEADRFSPLLSRRQLCGGPQIRSHSLGGREYSPQTIYISIASRPIVLFLRFGALDWRMTSASGSVFAPFPPFVFCVDPGACPPENTLKIS